MADDELIDYDHEERKPKAQRYRTVNGKTTKICPECGKDLVIRTNKATRERFLGCSQWPQCTHTEPLPEDVRLRLVGAKGLPGF